LDNAIEYFFIERNCLFSGTNPLEPFEQGMIARVQDEICEKNIP
jgi:hypothetical protein